MSVVAALIRKGFVSLPSWSFFKVVAMGELGMLSWVRVPALLPCPVGDVVGEGFVLQIQGLREDLVTPFNVETEIWSSWDRLHMWFTTPIAGSR